MLPATHQQPFDLSLSKVQGLCSGPFDKLRVNGGVVEAVLLPSTHQQPFGLSLSKVQGLCSGPFDKLRVNGGGVDAVCCPRPTNNRSA